MMPLLFLSNHSLPHPSQRPTIIPSHIWRMSFCSPHGT
jgi:hypothetical protein